jgi:DNA replication protein DnaC
VLYHRLPRLLGDLALARGDGRYPQPLARLGNARLLVLDDWGLEPLTDIHRRDPLEILEDRYDRRYLCRPATSHRKTEVTRSSRRSRPGSALFDVPRDR